eukprot:gb/GFBE01076841.1/.p1 GENE.gb/GFBE01076841.1/~~gb/GFBE01076841.1/.p1  ORF type:complete len:420 (+),score=21.22 gb/GFBE01076841.1/:1-1260(+)
MLCGFLKFSAEVFLLVGLLQVTGDHGTYPSSFKDILMNDLSSTPAILSCFYGYAGCIGVADTSISALRQAGCNVVGNDSHGVPSSMQIATLCNQAHNSVKRTPLPVPMDGMPCIFSFPPDVTQMSISDIEIDLADGTTINPHCYSLSPATELTHLHTILLMGTFGAKTTGTYPVAVRVSNVRPFVPPNVQLASAYGPWNLAYSGNMRYNDTSVELTRARLMTASMAEELDGTGVTGGSPLAARAGNAGPSTCKVSFSQATHSLQVMFNGGASKDGINHMDATGALTFFETKIAGSALGSAEVLGLADEGNPDNYFEICLKLTSLQLQSAQSGGMTVKTPCDTASNSALYGPKGMCAEANSACTATPCQTKTVVVDLTLAFPALSAPLPSPSGNSSVNNSSPNTLKVVFGLAVSLILFSF